MSRVKRTPRAPYMDHEAGERLLLDICDAWASRNVKVFLQCGTALGAVREHDFIAYDLDLDVALRYEDAQGQWGDVARDLSQKGYRVKFHHKPLGRCRALTVTGDGAYAHVAAYMLDGPNRFCPSSFQDYALVLPMEMFHHGETVTLRGHEFLVPGPAEEYLELNYGPEWRVPAEGDYKSRCRVHGYRLGEAILTRNHTPEHLCAVHVEDGFYAYLSHPGYTGPIFNAIAVAIPKGSTVLDVGCGTGLLAEALAGVDYLGIDGSEEAVRRAQERAPGKFECARLETYHWMAPADAVWHTLVFSGILSTVVLPAHRVQLVESYKRAFKAKQLIVSDLERLDTTDLQQRYNRRSTQLVEADIPGKKSVYLKRKIEVYDL